MAGRQCRGETLAIGQFFHNLYIAHVANDVGKALLLDYPGQYINIRNMHILIIFKERRGNATAALQILPFFTQ
jgi:hypothetical protein